MLQRLDLTNSRTVLFEKTNKHSDLIFNMIYLLDGAYYFQWPEYPESTLFYQGDECVFQINDWFELCYMDLDTAKTHFPQEYNYRFAEGQKAAGIPIKKLMNIPDSYCLHLAGSLPIASLGRYEVNGMESKKEKEKNDRYRHLIEENDKLTFDEKILKGAGVISRLDDYRTDLFRNVLHKRILARR